MWLYLLDYVWLMFRLLGHILLLTPSLGLFDTLHHGRLGSLPVEVSSSTSLFDHSNDGFLISFNDAWEPFRFNNISDFFHIPFIGVSFILVSIGFIHICVNSLLLKLTTKNTSLFSSIFHGLHSIITPLLHVDWELYYISDIKHESIIRCWHK